MAHNKHNADRCDQTPPVCDICRKRHLTALHVEATPCSKDKLNTATTETKSTTTACTQVCGEEETSRSCARIVLVRAYHQSNPAKKITTYAVLDDQSTDMFIADTLLEQLEVDTTASSDVLFKCREQLKGLDQTKSKTGALKKELP